MLDCKIEKKQRKFYLASASPIVTLRYSNPFDKSQGILHTVKCYAILSTHNCNVTSYTYKIACTFMYEKESCMNTPSEALRGCST